jgi:putative FmdB family regulatory protein
MPIYEYSCSQCDERFEKLLKFSQMTEPLAEACPTCNTEGSITQMASTFSLGDPVRLGVKRPDAGFTEVLSKIKQAHPKHNMGNSKFSGTRTV